jgi:hypothetical protein
MWDKQVITQCPMLIECEPDLMIQRY